MFLQALNIAPADRKALQHLARSTAIPVSRLRALDAHGFEPTAAEMAALAKFLGLSETAFRLRTGFINRALRKRLAASAEEVEAVLKPANPSRQASSTDARKDVLRPAFQTDLG